MKTFYNKKTTIITLAGAVFTSLIIFNSCISEKAAAKSGVELWSENCQRCHNTPSPSTFSPEQWETIGMHMQTRALLTDNEKNKIVEFLKQ